MRPGCRKNPVWPEIKESPFSKITPVIYFLYMTQKKHLTIDEYELLVTVEKDPSGGFISRCDTWDACYAQGDTLEEAINEISYVASSLIELYHEEHMTVPLKVKKTSEQVHLPMKFTFPLIVSAQ